MRLDKLSVWIVLLVVLNYSRGKEDVKPVTLAIIMLFQVPSSVLSVRTGNTRMSQAQLNVKRVFLGKNLLLAHVPSVLTALLVAINHLPIKKTV